MFRAYKYISTKRHKESHSKVTGVSFCISSEKTREKRVFTISPMTEMFKEKLHCHLLHSILRTEAKIRQQQSIKKSIQFRGVEANNEICPFVNFTFHTHTCLMGLYD
jgi:hypothetical protein